MKPDKIPQTDSIETLANFWDTQDVTDFETELEEVTEQVFEPSQETMLTIHLQPQEADLLKKLASEKGLEDSALLSEWVREKLQQI